jgi:hypothetical protein
MLLRTQVAPPFAEAKIGALAKIFLDEAARLSDEVLRSA